MTDAILEAMLVHEHNDVLVRTAISVLERIAAESDCMKQLGGLEKAVQRAKEDPEQVLQKLAAVDGLCQVPRLRAIFNENGTLVLQSIDKLIQEPPFQGKHKVVHAGILVAKNLGVKSSGDITEFFIAVASLGCRTELERMAEADMPAKNLLIDVAQALSLFAASGRFVGSLDPCVAATVQMMHQHQESIRVQMLCMDTLTNLCLAHGGDRHDPVLSSGGGSAVEAVIGNLKTSPMHLAVQIAGFTLLSSCAKHDPTCGPDLIAALQPLSDATRLHANSTELRSVLAPLSALLMPSDHLEDAIDKQLQQMQESVEEADLDSLKHSLMELNKLLVSAEGSKSRRGWAWGI
eukprot:GHVS01034214.1.p1 GENE.GHVS01034214.1~~GHVS01034214.1.p1  ORF type:complete len:404 (-),score=55.79 GHVS01034214.1:666-1712(-)